MACIAQAFPKNIRVLFRPSRTYTEIRIIFNPFLIQKFSLGGEEECP
jgi:hypothetical protein